MDSPLIQPKTHLIQNYKQKIDRYRHLKSAHKQIVKDKLLIQLPNRLATNRLCVKALLQYKVTQRICRKKMDEKKKTQKASSKSLYSIKVVVYMAHLHNCSLAHIHCHDLDQTNTCVRISIYDTHTFGNCPTHTHDNIKSCCAYIAEKEQHLYMQ